MASVGVTDSSPDAQLVNKIVPAVKHMIASAMNWAKEMRRFVTLLTAPIGIV